MKTFVLLIVGLLLPAISLVPRTGAQSGGIQISPAKSVFNANPGDKEQLTITVKNNDTAAGTFNAKFNNFTAGDDESGQPKIIEDASYVRGIKTWLSGPSAISINSNVSRDYTLTINVPPGTKVGTYYGSVFFHNPANDGTSTSVGSLIFVNVGTITQQVEIEEFDTKGIIVDSFGSAKGLFVVRLKNTGNGYTVPGIKVEVLDDKKAVIETIDGNGNPGGVLPETIRKYTAAFSKQLEPGKTYSARVTVTTENGKSIVAEKTFVETPAPAQSAAGSQSKKNQFLLPAIASLLLVGIAGGILLAIRKRRKALVAPSTLPQQSSASPSLPTGPDSSSIQTPTVSMPSPQTFDSPPTSKNDNP